MDAEKQEPASNPLAWATVVDNSAWQEIVAQLAELRYLRQEVRAVHAMMAAILKKTGPLALSPEQRNFVADLLAGRAMGEVIEWNLTDGTLVLSFREHVPS